MTNKAKRLLLLKKRLAKTLRKFSVGFGLQESLRENFKKPFYKLQTTHQLHLVHYRTGILQPDPCSRFATGETLPGTNQPLSNPLKAAPHSEEAPAGGESPRHGYLIPAGRFPAQAGRLGPGAGPLVPEQRPPQGNLVELLDVQEEQELQSVHGELESTGETGKSQAGPGSPLGGGRAPPALGRLRALTLLRSRSSSSALAQAASASAQRRRSGGAGPRRPRKSSK